MVSDVMRRTGHRMETGDNEAGFCVCGLDLNGVRWRPHVLGAVADKLIEEGAIPSASREAALVWLSEQNREVPLYSAPISWVVERCATVWSTPTDPSSL
jgi:hypothetical protein